MKFEVGKIFYTIKTCCADGHEWYRIGRVRVLKLEDGAIWYEDTEEHRGRSYKISETAATYWWHDTFDAALTESARYTTEVCKTLWRE